MNASPVAPPAIDTLTAGDPSGAPAPLPVPPMIVATIPVVKFTLRSAAFVTSAITSAFSLVVRIIAVGW